MPDIFQITQERKESLEKELHELKSIKRIEILERLQYAKGLGDLSENAEYHSARELQGKNETRIQEIESILKHAELVKKTKSDVVQLASLVVIQKKGEKEKREFCLVGPEEADMVHGKLSIESPIGKAIFGKKKGDNANVETPSGVIVYSILDVQ